MSQTVLSISGPGGQRHYPLTKSGLFIGRSAECQVVLDSDLVSRRHVHMFQDPYRRWVIQDLGSRNGTLVDGRPVKMHVLAPGEAVAVGPFALQILEPAMQVPADPSITSSTIVVDGEDEQLSYGGSMDGVRLSREWLGLMSAMLDELARAPDATRLYAHACQMLRCLGGTAMVLRLPEGGEGLPQLLACEFAAPSGFSPAREPVVSRRVLQAVAKESTAVMAGAGAPSYQLTELTVQVAHRPRTVFCAPLGDLREVRDVLYVEVSAEQVQDDLFDFVRVVARQIEMARVSLQLAQSRAQRQVLDRQLAMAREIQNGLTPAGIQRADVDLAVYYQPAMWVGGDYCDVWQLADGRLAFALGDVAGKGLPAAMVMANLQAALRNTLAFCGDLAAAVTHVNKFLGGHLPDGMFVTLFVGLFSPSCGKLEYVNAGHIPPLVIEGAGSCRWLGKPSNPPLGPFTEPFKADVENIPHQAGLVLVSDGVTEAPSPANELFGLDRLKELCGGQGPESADSLIKRIIESVSTFRQDLPQQDDVTVLAMIRRHV